MGREHKNSGDDTIKWCYESIDFSLVFGFFCFEPLQQSCLREGLNESASRRPGHEQETQMGM